MVCGIFNIHKYHQEYLNSPAWYILLGFICKDVQEPLEVKNGVDIKNQASLCGAWLI